MRALLTVLAAMLACKAWSSETVHSPMTQARPQTTQLSLETVLQAAREHPDVLAATRQVLAARADVLAADRDACLAAGMVDFIGKPIAPEPLLETLRRWLPPRSQSDRKT